MIQRYLINFVQRRQIQKVVVVRKVVSTDFGKIGFAGRPSSSRSDSQSSFIMSPISVFPTEILECITSILTTSEQMRLWQCGDRVLNIKLKNGGLKRTSLCWSSPTWMPWPRWYFRTLEGLTDVEWAMDSGTSLCPTLELILLPKTLQRLHLACDDVFILLRQQNINMNDILPTLHTLHLAGSRLSEENLENLPSNLIELFVDSEASHIESSTIFGELPRIIERLTLLFSIVDQSEHENQLPNTLISLDIQKIGCSSLSFNWISKLPKSLKSLKMDIISFYPDWSTLPPQLEELNLNGSYPHYVALKTLPKLPKTLRSLEIWGLEYSEENLFSLLPQNLTRFTSRFGSVAPDGLEQLPVSLTDLGIDVNAADTNVVSFYHPETIRISLGEGRFSKQLSILSFPTKLQYLRMDYISDDICAMLPPGLRNLRTYEGLITTKGASKLPKSLTHLDTDFGLFDSNEAISYIGFIATIILRGSTALPRPQLNENWLSCLLHPPTNPNSHQSSSDGSNLHGVNHHVASLSLYGFARESSIRPLVQKPFFEALANFTKLKSLIISDRGKAATVSSDWLHFIPQSVTSLFISHIDTYPTATQLSLLPKNLIDLLLIVKSDLDMKCDWNDETLGSLPRSLQRFCLEGSFSNLTRRACEYLPPNLQNTTLANDPVIAFRTPLERVYG